MKSVTKETSTENPEIIMTWAETRPNTIAMIEKFRDDVYKVFQEQGVHIDGIVIEKTGKSLHGDGVIQTNKGKVFYCTDLRSIANLSRNPECLEGVAIHEATHIKHDDSLIHTDMKSVYEAQSILKALTELHKEDPKAFCNYLSSNDENYKNLPKDIQDAAQILKPSLDFIQKNKLGSLSDEELHVKFKDDPKLRLEMAKVMAGVAAKIKENNYLFESLGNIYDSICYKFDLRDEKREVLIGMAMASLRPILKDTGDFNTMHRAAEYKADEATLDGKDPKSLIKYLRKNSEYYAKRDVGREFPTTHPLREDRISRLESLLAERDKKGVRGLH